MAEDARLTFLEFFAGGGMARLGLGAPWRCLFANDFDPVKRAAYGANFGLDDHHGGDIHALGPGDLPPGRADLAWASSPCQDLSLAGGRGGLGGARSGAFFGFWRLIEALAAQDRAPRMIVIENVAGLLTSSGGDDFHSVVALLAARGYLASALVLNAEPFAPQSRPRIFIIGAAPDCAAFMTRARPAADVVAPAALLDCVDRLPAAASRNWRWIAARPHLRRNQTLADILEAGAPFDAPAVTTARLDAMAPRQRAQIDQLIRSGDRHVGAAFRRVRIEDGEKKNRIEARFDGIAGCVRTPAGGSSRQIIIDIDRGKARSRLMTPREAARAMGLADDYVLPTGATAALKVIGDGVSPPVVRWISHTLLEPALKAHRRAA